MRRIVAITFITLVLVFRNGGPLPDGGSATGFQALVAEARAVLASPGLGWFEDLDHPCVKGTGRGMKPLHEPVHPWSAARVTGTPGTRLPKTMNPLLMDRPPPGKLAKSDESGDRIAA